MTHQAANHLLQVDLLPTLYSSHQRSESVALGAAGQGGGERVVTKSDPAGAEMHRVFMHEEDYVLIKTALHFSPLF